MIKKLTIQALNQELFRAGESSWNQSSFINNHVQHEKQILPCRENALSVVVETLKNFILSEIFIPQITKIMIFLPKIRAFFLKKGRGDLHSLVARVPLPKRNNLTKLMFLLITGLSRLISKRSLISGTNLLLTFAKTLNSAKHQILLQFKI